MDLDEDAPIPMAAVPEEVEQMTGIRPHPGTIRRWRTCGVGGVCLRVLRVGGRYVTRRSWLQEFFETTRASDQANDHAVSIVRTRQRQREIDAAKRKMVAAGLM